MFTETSPTIEIELTPEIMDQLIARNENGQWVWGPTIVEPTKEWDQQEYDNYAQQQERKNENRLIDLDLLSEEIREVETRGLKNLRRLVAFITQGTTET